jgi:hypothetical protein
MTAASELGQAPGSAPTGVLTGNGPESLDSERRNDGSVNPLG